MKRSFFVLPDVLQIPRPTGVLDTAEKVQVAINSWEKNVVQPARKRDEMQKARAYELAQREYKYFYS